MLNSLLVFAVSYDTIVIIINLLASLIIELFQLLVVEMIDEESSQFDYRNDERAEYNPKHSKASTSDISQLNSRLHPLRYFLQMRDPKLELLLSI